MTTSVSKSQFKSKALEFFREIEKGGDAIIITNHGKPTLEIRRYQNEDYNPLAILRDSVLRYDDPMEPVGEEDWEIT